ncbi:MAG: hypothetical protein EOP94_03975 [Zymomonas sp.]|nr:MAG: hypothetical protein EOP94_03975 [Zymomonas sp.]
MRGLVTVGVLAALLAGCGEVEKSQAQRELDDEKAIAEVEAAQTPPPDVVTPQRITNEERARYKLSDSGCSFAVNNPELGAQAILQLNVGYMKFDGQMERFAPDAGAADGPAGTSTKYDGGRHGLIVRFDTAQAAKVGGDGVSMPAQITLQDGRQRTVYVAEGTSLCG